MKGKSKVLHGVNFFMIWPQSTHIVTPDVVSWYLKNGKPQCQENFLSLKISSLPSDPNSWSSVLLCKNVWNSQSKTFLEGWRLEHSDLEIMSGAAYWGPHLYVPFASACWGIPFGCFYEKLQLLSLLAVSCLFLVSLKIFKLVLISITSSHLSFKYFF